VDSAWEQKKLPDVKRVARRPFGRQSPASSTRFIGLLIDYFFAKYLHTLLCPSHKTSKTIIPNDEELVDRAIPKNMEFYLKVINTLCGKSYF
jgi:hypothetical protein